MPNYCMSKFVSVNRSRRKRSSFALAFLFAATLAAQTVAVTVTVGGAKDTKVGIGGRMDLFLSTSFQLAGYSYQFFTQNPTATIPLGGLFSKHIRLQTIADAVPQKDAATWDFMELDTIVPPIQSVADHSPEYQIAVAPAFMNSASTGNILPAHFQDFANFSANLVKYYNQGGFLANGRRLQSPSPYPITWWGIFNEPNINGFDGFELQPMDYVNLYNMTVPAMQAVDPNIKFVAVELADFGGEVARFLPTFAQTVTAQVDAVATHFYSTCNQMDSDQTLFDSVPVFGSDVESIYLDLAQNPKLGLVPVWVTENNVNADYDMGGGISACNAPKPYVLDQRASNAFFAAWRPYVFSTLAKAGARSLYQWDFNADGEFGEVNAANGQYFLSYWVDFYLAHLFPAPPGADILQVTSPDPNVETLAVRNDDGSVVILVANHAVKNATDNNGTGAARNVTLDLTALGLFHSVTAVTIDATTGVSEGPAVVQTNFTSSLTLKFNGYGVTFLRLNPSLPTLPANGVVNAASYVGGSLAPGELVSIFGINVGPLQGASFQLSPPGFFSNLLSGTRVLFDAVPSPMVYAANGQLSAIVPYSVAGHASTRVQIDYLGGVSDTVTLPVAAAMPGIFTRNQQGSGEGAILNQDGITMNSAANPEKRGNIVSIYATGAGQTTPAGVDGKLAAMPLPAPVLKPTATIGGLPATVTYAGESAGSVAGVIQINVQIPMGVAPGPSVPVQLTFGGASSQANVTMAVR